MAKTVKYHVSVVIIVYNTKKYIKNCLDSVFAQKFRNMEIVIVDNASTDGTTDIISDYIKGKKNVNLKKNSENLGGAAAGNIGIDMARGEYIFIMDSDDIIPPNTIKRLFLRAKKSECDVIIGRAKSIYGKYIRNLKFKFYNIPYSLTGRYESYHQCKELFISPFYWGKLYRTDFLKKNKIYMPEETLYADLYFSTLVIKKANGIEVCDVLSYLWRRFDQKSEQKSITSDPGTIKKFSDRIDSYYKVESIFQNEAELQYIRLFNLIRLLILVKDVSKNIEFAHFFFEKMYEYMEKISYEEIMNCPYLTAKKRVLCYYIKQNNFEKFLKCSDPQFEIFDKDSCSLIHRNDYVIDVPDEFLQQRQQKPIACRVATIKKRITSYRITFDVITEEENEFEFIRIVLVEKKGKEKYITGISGKVNSKRFIFSLPVSVLYRCNKNKCRIAIEMLYNENFSSNWLTDENGNIVIF